MTNMFRRRVEIVSTPQDATREVRAALEDDFHHFRVWLRHSDGMVREIGGEAVRYPYSACPQASGQLEQLIGMPLSHIAHSVTRQTDAQHQCTHLLDLAGLAIANAARGTLRRCYDVQVPDRVDEHTTPILLRDGRLLLSWDVRGSIIQGPAPYCGVNLRKGMARWALSHLPEEDAEAALLLRRCTQISLGRQHPLDSQVHASSTSLCFSQQPARAAQALRIKGSTWDFSDTAARLCSGDQDWLAGE
ncbi:DUF2889 domain-containing protein [Pseudomonas aeruginosa]|uniref:DUF2889 domain-containing protein n=1 Tax=Pseudomonas aeruginosa group TaxID=136841 RepID=UPI00053D7839|nr:DUF2889 domain-containing protein [Pseudomonas aeruginosa]EKU8922211.1 DUF2889 domain-containing protein [Pseudomonas aeruginosa]EKU9151931.1 DUF2889 domain-containing protein [Pseudomonas aeruginosa]EKW2384195.1 DUF2889 domain-containing protein [Pseudomonas aeruginosa]ELB4692662.1 DUF2889 domain-containing protein [Pseudomonas aeruginosa]MBD1298901.1 DUF2889 domain-containing protein [Pseudomonas aeruginosa]